MAKAIAVLQGLGQKMSKKEHQECRTLQINMPTPSAVDIEFTNITLKVSEGIRKRSELLVFFFTLLTQ